MTLSLKDKAWLLACRLARNEYSLEEMKKDGHSEFSCEKIQELLDKTKEKMKNNPLAESMVVKARMHTYMHMSRNDFLRKSCIGQLHDDLMLLSAEIAPNDSDILEHESSLVPNEEKNIEEYLGKLRERVKEGDLYGTLSWIETIVATAMSELLYSKDIPPLPPHFR